MQASIYANTSITFISYFIYFPADGGKEKDGAAICHHHNNVRTAAERCAIGMMLCVGAPVHIWMQDDIRGRADACGECR